MAAVVAVGLLALVGAKQAWAEGLTFAPAQKFPLESVGKQLTADFNGDGKEDFAVTNSKAKQVSALLGNGDGTFQSASKPTVGPRPGSVTTADFNSDGKADLAVANNMSYYSEPSGVSVLLGNGDGTFQEAVDYAGESGPDHVITADFNGDGNEDLATANYGSDFTGGGGVLVMLGEGDGTFQDPSSVAEVNNKPNSITAADFDGDRNVDLATTHYDFADGNPGFVSVRLGYGDGANFQEAQNFTVANYARSITSPDFNADNYPDLATSHAPETNGISVLMNIPPPDDTTAPTIDWVYPEEGARYVYPTEDVYAGFSEAMDRSTLTTIDLCGDC